MSSAADFPRSRPQVSDGSKSESRKPCAFSMQKRLMSLAKFMTRISQVFAVWQGRCGVPAPHMQEVRRDETRHPRIEIRGRADDADIAEFRLRLAREMAQHPCPHFRSRIRNIDA